MNLVKKNVLKCFVKHGLSHHEPKKCNSIFCRVGIRVVCTEDNRKYYFPFVALFSVKDTCFYEVTHRMVQLVEVKTPLFMHGGWWTSYGIGCV